MDCREISQDQLDALLEERDRLRARVAELEASVQQQRAIATEEAARGILRARVKCGKPITIRSGEAGKGARHD